MTTQLSSGAAPERKVPPTSVRGAAMRGVVARPGREAVEAKGWLRAHKWLLLRRASQLGILALFLVGPWLGWWINDLTARDPYFILPAVNMAVMWLTQKMTPNVGMDPMQQKMMQFMPLVFGVMMAFMPAGLVLYWVTNGGLGLLQQWWMTKRHGQPPASNAGKAVVATK